MKVFTKEVAINTKRRREIVNITQTVENFLKEAKIGEGIVLIFTPHATCALSMNEDEPLIKKDYLQLLEKLVPENYEYNHNKIDNNADSHLLSFLLKPFLVIPIKNGTLVKGTWQELFLVELDGPRTRRIVITAIGKVG